MSTATISNFSYARSAAAESFAASVGGRVENVPVGPYSSGGFLRVVHDNAVGLELTKWSSCTLPRPGRLTQRGNVQVGDLVYSSHFGERAVSRTHHQGETTTLYFAGDAGHVEAYPSDSLIPVLPART